MNKTTNLHPTQVVTSRSRPRRQRLSDEGPPHEADHGVQVGDGRLVPSEDLSPGTLVQREPGAELLHQLVAAAGVEDLWVVPAQEREREHEGNITREHH